MICSQLTLQMPSDVQLRVSQIIHGAEGRVSRLIGDARDKIEDLADKHSGACDLIQQCFQELHESGDGQAQRLAEVSLDLKAKLESLFQAYGGSTDRVLQEFSQQSLVLESILHQVTNVNNTHAFYFQKASESNQRSTDMVLRGIHIAKDLTFDMIAQQEARGQARSSQVSCKLERMNDALASVNRCLEEMRSLPQVAPSSEINISVAGRELLSSLLVLWKGLNGTLRNLT